MCSLGRLVLLVLLLVFRGLLALRVRRVILVLPALMVLRVLMVLSVRKAPPGRTVPLVRQGQTAPKAPPDPQAQPDRKAQPALTRRYPARKATKAILARLVRKEIPVPIRLSPVRPGHRESKVCRVIKVRLVRTLPFLDRPDPQVQTERTVQQGRKESKGSKGSKATPVQPERQVHKETKEFKETPVLQAQTEQTEPPRRSPPKATSGATTPTTRVSPSAQTTKY